MFVHTYIYQHPEWASTDQSATNLLNLKASKPSTHQKLLSDWSIYVTVLHMIRRSKINKRLPEMTPKEMLLDLSANKFKKRKDVVMGHPKGDILLTL